MNARISNASPATSSATLSRSPRWSSSPHTSADPDDPSTWTYGGSTWQQEWLANSRLNPATASNAKIGWAVLDLGTTVVGLETLFLWNNTRSNPGEYTDTWWIRTTTTTACPTTVKPLPEPIRWTSIPGPLVNNELMKVFMTNSLDRTYYRIEVELPGGSRM